MILITLGFAFGLSPMINHDVSNNFFFFNRDCKYYSTLNSYIYFKIRKLYKTLKK